MAGESIRRVGIIFSGGPAPAANAVIAAAATAFLEDAREVVGFFHGYSNLQEYDPKTNPMMEGEHYRVFTEGDLRGLRNQRGIAIGTARANPGKGVTTRADLADPEKSKRLRQVHAALASVNVDALISIGGDDTLKTANLLYELQSYLPDDANHTPAKNYRQRLQGHRFYFWVFHGGRFHGQGAHEPARRRPRDEQLLHR